MQQTRRHILTILRERGEATVDDIVAELEKRRGKEITAVTVRHHLTRLQEDDLITTPQMRHRSTPGRPQHIYTLTEKAIAQFPNNYQRLAAGLLEGIRQHLPPDGVNVILEDVADRMARDARIPDAPLSERLDKVVSYLNKQGYSASWESCEGGFVLQTSNCPYHQIAATDKTMCEMDIRFVSSLLGVVPRRLTHMVEGDSTCAYLVPDK
jgi:predicted ArsR family transcriptional regulator